MTERGKPAGEKPRLGRREALVRLGLSALVVYSAPTILHLDRQARAVQPSCTGKGKGKGNPWCKGSGQHGDSLEEWKRNHGNRYAYGVDDQGRGGDRSGSWGSGSRNTGSYGNDRGRSTGSGGSDRGSAARNSGGWSGRRD